MKRIPLSPIDHIFTGVGSYPIEFVFAYQDTIDAHRLQRSLEKVTRHFPPVSSRLARLSDHSYGLEPCDDGVRFEVIESDASFLDPEARYEFLDPVNSVEGEPLTRIRLTQTPQRSVLGVSMSHAVGDGFSYFYFLSSWARLFHGGPIVDPSHRRELLIPDPPDRDNRITPADLLSDSGIFWDQRRLATARDRIRWDRFSISKAELSRTLAEARQDCDARLSHNDVVAAKLWKSYTSKWDPAGECSTSYASCPVDVRRILTALPTTYFGNAVALATTRLDRGALADAPLGKLATMIRASVASVDEGYVRSALAVLEALRAQEGLGVLERVHVIHPRAGILITNLSRLPVHEIEFDAGAPTAFDILTPAGRGAVVLPAEDGVDIRVCHPPEVV